MYKYQCPMEGKCRAKNIVYCANIKTETEGAMKTYKYYGMTSNEFIVRYRNHKSNMNCEKYKNATELSKFIWDLKGKGINYEIKWEIVRKAQPYQPGGKYCNLCIAKAISIAYPKKGEILINSREEIIKNCKHKSRWKLEKY